MNSTSIISLLRSTELIISHQREKEILLGEKFNLFSILNVETRENATHSALIFELLNPKGSHLMNDLFLRLFLSEIGNETMNPKTACVRTEFSIGSVNDVEKTGGRIDLYLWDDKGNTICIENKIYASDQPFQIERYYNHNRSKNFVYYLTLFGNDPTPESKGDLKAKDHYSCISYKTHILAWLQACMKEAANVPILRESLKQYILLIKKLTLSIDNMEEKELFDVILSHTEEADFIASNYKKALCGFYTNLRKKVYVTLKQQLDDKYDFHLGANTDQNYSQIWIKLKGKGSSNLYFGLESFAFKRDDLIDDLFIGIFINEGKYLPQYGDLLGERKSDYWRGVEILSDYNGYKANVRDSQTLKKLATDPFFQDGFVNHIVSEVTIFMNKYHDTLVKLNA